jgi:hypothetical protein
VKIGPSLKLSSARLEIPRRAGLHLLDPHAQVVDPDASDLGEATIRVSLHADGSAAPELEIGTAEVQATGAHLARTSDGIELRLPAGATTEQAQRLLRAVAIKLEQPLSKTVSLVVQIASSSGELLSEARASVQAEEVEETPSLASTSGT